MDHATIDEALARVAAAKLPPPSIVVDSGSGAHLYWLLEEPYRIDDAGDHPSPVELEWPPREGKSRKPRPYVQDGAERIYLDQNKHAFRLSSQARRLEDVVAGLAAAIGGDHTHDTARLLRVPGTWNRKNQRNCTEPKRTRLVFCNRNLRYRLALFEPLAETSPTAEMRQQIAAIPLPQPRKLTGAKQDQLDDRIASYAITPDGLRSNPRAVDRPPTDRGCESSVCEPSAAEPVSRSEVRRRAAIGSQRRDAAADHQRPCVTR